MKSRKPKKKKQPLWVRVQNNIRANLLSGLLVLVPLGITAFVLRFLYNFTAGRLAPLMKNTLGRIPDVALAPTSVAILLLVLYVIGLVATVMAGRRLIALAEALIRRIPVIKTVYSASKQFVDAVSLQEAAQGFQTAALVDFPFKGMKAIGFVTGRIESADGRVYYKVFIPTTPNITVGLFQLVAPEEVMWCDLSVEEAVKCVVSGGILAPDELVQREANHADLSDDEEDSAA